MKTWSAALLFTITVSACDGNTLKQLAQIQNKLDDELVAEQNLANNLNQFRTERERLEQQVQAATGVTADQTLLAFVEANPVAGTPVVSASQSRDDVELSGQGGGVAALDWLRVWSSKAPALVLRSLQIDADSTWKVRLERPPQVKPEYRSEAPHIDDPLPELGFFSSREAKIREVHIQKTRQELAELDKVIGAVREQNAKARAATTALTQAQQIERLGPSMDLLSRVFGGSPAALSQGTWSANGDTLTIQSEGSGLPTPAPPLGEFEIERQERSGTGVIYHLARAHPGGH